jgi:hypothetical protein
MNLRRQPSQPSCVQCSAGYLSHIIRVLWLAAICHQTACPPNLSSQPALVRRKGVALGYLSAPFMSVYLYFNYYSPLNDPQPLTVEQRRFLDKNIIPFHYANRRGEAASWILNNELRFFSRFPNPERNSVAAARAKTEILKVCLSLHSRTFNNIVSLRMPAAT